MIAPPVPTVAPRPVGILGGMGPEATVLLQQRLIAAVPARDDADHVPLLIDMNPQVPSRIARLIEGTGADPAPVLAAMARRLQAAGAKALAMPCNTAHHYRDAITGAASIPLIDMVSLAAQAAATAAPGGTVGMLASPAVRRLGLFEAALIPLGLTVLWPTDSDAMLGAIRAIKAGDPGDAPKNVLAQGSEDMSSRGSDVQLVACSEFSMIAGAVPEAARPIDTLDCLVAAIVAFSKTAAAERQTV